MLSARIEGATRVVGKSQGYLGLPIKDEKVEVPAEIRDIVIDCTVNGRTPAMVTAWEPTPEDLVKLNAGASVHVRILGNRPPPMMVEVGPVPLSE